LLAIQVLPWLADRFDDRPDTQLLFVSILVLVGGAFVGQAVGLIIGTRLHLALPRGGARRTDRAFGAAAGVLGVAAAVWLLVPTAANARGWPAEQTRRSTIARALNSWLPDPPSDLAAVLRNQFPQVFADLRSAPDLGAPPASSGLTEEQAERIARSTVKVEGQACGRLQDGSGSVVGDGLIATNAHVIAGAEDVTVERYPDGEILDATVVAFDPARDVAVLAVDLDRPALPIGDADVATTGGVFGHPGGRPLRVAPFSVGERITAVGTDIYNGARTERDVLVLAAALEPGDSGGALVDPAGAVVGIAFAIAPDRGNVAYALATSELQAVLGTVTGATVGTGPCTR